MNILEGISACIITKICNLACCLGVFQKAAKRFDFEQFVEKSEPLRTWISGIIHYESSVMQNRLSSSYKMILCSK